MATSGLTNWELTTLQLVQRAYAKIGIPGDGNALSTAQVTDGKTALNMAIQMGVTDGMPLWKRTILDFTPSATDQTYDVPLASKITAVYLLDSGGVQYDLIHKSLYDFMRLPTTSEGVPVHYTFGQEIQGYTVSIWPPTSDAATISDKSIRVVYQKEIETASGDSETLDFPAYWTTALVYRTALILAPEFGVPLPDRATLLKESDMFWTNAKGYDDEDGSIFIQPEARWRG